LCEDRRVFNAKKPLGEVPGVVPETVLQFNKICRKQLSLTFNSCQKVSDQLRDHRIEHCQKHP